MKRKINWLKHALDFLTVGISIFVGFQLNTYSEVSKQKKTLNNHREYVIEETLINQEKLKEAQNSVLESLKTLDALKSKIQQKEDINIIYHLTLKLMDDSGFFNIQTIAYKTLANSDISILKFDERKDIVSLYGNYDATDIVQNKALDGFNQYFNYLKANIQIYTFVTPKREVFETQKFSNILGEYRYLLKKKEKKYIDCQQRITQFLEKHQKRSR
ncbi:MAG: hypothetical protein AB8B65_06890 [Kordia sp.]|uniref:hypothetical protein n=1 Tax=Kordia sp. TaxID=1965332 RepID=UPI00385C6C38